MGRVSLSQLMYLLANALPHVSPTILRSRYDATASLLLTALRDYGHVESWLVLDSALRCLGTLLQTLPASTEEWNDEKVRVSWQAGPDLGGTVCV